MSALQLTRRGEVVKAITTGLILLVTLGVFLGLCAVTVACYTASTTIGVHK